jgi:nitric oxide reductase large subunit
MQDSTSIIPRHGRLWLLFGLSVSAAFFILGFFGREVYRQAPPIPAEVRTTDGRLLMTADSILTGQTVWQSTGGQQLGSIWGHGDASSIETSSRPTFTSGGSGVGRTSSRCSISVS